MFNLDETSILYNDRPKYVFKVLTSTKFRHDVVYWRTNTKEKNVHYLFSHSSSKWEEVPSLIMYPRKRYPRKIEKPVDL